MASVRYGYIMYILYCIHYTVQFFLAAFCILCAGNICLSYVTVAWRDTIDQLISLVYCMIYLASEHTFVDEYNVLTCQLWALFMYWCHMCCLRFRRYNLVVGSGRQMVSLISVHGRGFLFDIYIGSFTFPKSEATLLREQGP